MYMYFPDRLPAQRQLHYQLCDIMDDQLQKIIHGNDGKEKECTVSMWSLILCIKRSWYICALQSIGGGGYIGYRPVRSLSQKGVT